MKFGYFANIHDSTKSRDYSEMVNEMREVARFLDDAGFDIIWLPEHHFQRVGPKRLIQGVVVRSALRRKISREVVVGIAVALCSGNPHFFAAQSFAQGMQRLYFVVDAVDTRHAISISLQHGLL